MKAGLFWFMVLGAVNHGGSGTVAGLRGSSYNPPTVRKHPDSVSSLFHSMWDLSTFRVGFPTSFNFLEIPS